MAHYPTPDGWGCALGVAPDPAGSAAGTRLLKPRRPDGRARLDEPLGSRSLPRRHDTIRVAMRTMRPVHDEWCSVAACAEIIGAKWTALLVHDLSEGARRFSELEHSCSGISPRTLSDRLRSLENEGVVVRRSRSTPPRVEYELTAKGQALLPIISEMRRFGRTWLRREEAAATV